MSPGPLPGGLCGWLMHRGQWPGDHLWPVFQEAIFDKSTGKIVLKTFSLYKKLLTLFRADHDQGEASGMNRTWDYFGLEGGQRAAE